MKFFFTNTSYSVIFTLTLGCFFAFANQASAQSECINYTVSNVTFQPLSGAGTTVGLIDDQVSAPINIGFDFTFFDQEFSQFRIGSNGFLTLGPVASPAITSQTLPNPANPNSLIAGWLLDMNPSINTPNIVEGVYYDLKGTAPNRRMEINYLNIRQNGTNLFNTFRIVLFESSNNIRVDCASCQGPTLNGTVTQGIENNDGTLAVFTPGINGAPFATGTNTSNLFSPAVCGNTPSISCPSNITVNNNQSFCTPSVSWPDPVVSDLDGGILILDCDALSGSNFNVGVTTVTCTVTDNTGLTNDCSFTVTVNDIFPPTINCPANIVMSNDAGQCGAIVNYNTNFNDECPGAILSCSKASGSFFDVGTETVTCTVTDAGGNTAMCAFTVTINDTEPPTINCQDITVQLDENGFANGNPFLNGAFVSQGDNCQVAGGVNITGPANYGCANVGTLNISVIKKDIYDNQSSCPYSVTIEDNLPPTAICQSLNVQIQANGEVVVPGAALNNGSTDNCASNLTFLIDGNPSKTFTCSDLTNTVTPNPVVLTVVDPGGNSSTCNAGVFVFDVAPATISCPSNITVGNDPGQCGANVSFNVIGSDNCSSFSIVSSPSSGSFFNVGTTTVNSTLTENNGGQVSCSFTVTVNDTENPVLNCPNDLSINAVTGTCAASFNAVVSVFDNCTLFPIINQNFIDLPVGPTPISFSRTDAAGNTGSCSFTVTITDGDAPSITCPANITTSNTAGQCGANVSFSAPTATDLCDASPTVSTDKASGSFFNVGVTTVTATATDAGGNTAMCTFTVTVNDTEDPTITCPADIVVNNDPNSCNAVVGYNPVASDNCSSFPVYQSDLQLGDIAFTSYKADNPDQFSFICLVNIAAGTTIIFTDNGWFSTGGFRPGEGTTTWVADNDILAGTQISVVSNVSDIGTSSGSMALSTGGDQIFAYQGTPPTGGDQSNFLAAIQMNGNWDISATSSNTSARPSVFTDGVNSLFISPEVDNGSYNCVNTDGSDINALRNSINTGSNWVVNNSPGSLSFPPACTWSFPTFSLTLSNIGGIASSNTFPVGVTNNILQVTDAAGNTASCSFDVTVNDNEAPMLTCPSDINVNADPGMCEAVVTYGEVTATENCTNATIFQTDLNLGDIAFTGYQSDNPDIISFVLLVDLASGVTINFTDNGWFAAGGFRSTEGTFAWTSNSNLPLGTEVSITSGSSASTGTAAPVLGSFALSTSGDQVFAYQGTAPVAGDESNFLAALQMNGNWDTDATSSNTSAKPSVFTDGMTSNAVSPEIDNASYNCTLPSPATPVNYRNSINMDNNWVGGNGIAQAVVPSECPFLVMPSGFSITQTSGFGSGASFPAGPTTNIFTATDATGNTGSCSFTVTVTDATPPTVNCPPDITIDTDPGVCEAVYTYQVTALDNCPPAIPTFTSDLNLGDIAFSSYTSDNPDEFSFVLLVNVANGTSIEFTDNGWFSTGGFRSGEGTITWTATVDLLAGTEVSITNNIASVGTASGSTALSSSGDQIFAYQGSAPVAGDESNFLAAIQMNGNWDTNATSSNTSAQPSVFTDGVNSISINPETDNATYNCAVSMAADAATLRAALNTSSNWTTSNGGGLGPAGCTFNIPNGFIPTQSSGLASGSAFPEGNTLNIFMVTDATGITSSCSFNVTVNDTEAPTASNPAAFNASCLSELPVPDPAIVTDEMDNCGSAFVEFLSSDGGNGGSGCPGDPFIMVRTYQICDGEASSGNCTTVTHTLTIEPDPIFISTSTSGVECSGATMGSINTSVIGGADCSPYEYAWTGPNGFTSTMPTLMNVDIGVYVLTVTDENGCTASVSVNLVPPPPVTPVAAPNSFFNGPNISCNGEMDGSVTVNTTGGTPPYSYQWGPNAGNSTMQTVNNLGAGTYNVTVTDVNGCTASSSTTLLESDPVVATAIVSSPISCNGFSDGEATASATGGIGLFSVLWDANANNQTTFTAVGLNAGTYSVTITDFNGCSDVATIDVNEPLPFSVTTQATSDYNGFNVSCPDAADGTASSTLTNGVAPFTYSWLDASNTEVDNMANANFLAPGTYTLVVTDANGCVASSTVTLNAPPALAASVNPNSDYNGFNVSCDGELDGSAQAMGMGGIPPYSYQWDDVFLQTTMTATNLGAGPVNVTVTDANGCTATATATLSSPAPLTVATNVDKEISCFGFADGTASAIPAGGTAPYTFQWDAAAGGQTTGLAVDLAAGTYSVTVTDANGCTATATVTLTEPAELTADASQEQATSCFGDADGVAAASVAGGTPPYNYTWSDNQMTAIATGLASGTYTVTVSDNLGCTVVASVTINDPALLTSAVGLVVDATCTGFSDGSASVAGIGGTPPYSYEWDNGELTDAANMLGAGPHTVTITDANGCTTTNMVTIGEPAPLMLSGSITDASSSLINDGAVDLSVTGGTPPYTYNWSTGATTEDVFNLAGGSSYTVIVTDANNCSETATFQIGTGILVPGEICLNVLLQGAFNPAFTGPNDLMQTVLNDQDLLPLSQPFTGGQWNYTGTESFASQAAIPNNVVDWLLITIREGANPNTIFDRIAVVLLSDGTVQTVVGSAVVLALNPNDTYYVEVSHLNHLSIASAMPLQPGPNGEICWDFTTDLEQAYRNPLLDDDPQREIATLQGSFYSMIAGNSLNLDCLIDLNDVNAILNNFGAAGIYDPTDVNLDGLVGINDINMLAGNYNNNCHLPY